MLVAGFVVSVTALAGGWLCAVATPLFSFTLVEAAFVLSVAVAAVCRFDDSLCILFVLCFTTGLTDPEGMLAGSFCLVSIVPS